MFLRGSVLAVDNPTRQSFVIEMVGPDRVVNAVSLNSALVHMARMAGPAVAGVLIVTVGVEPCFLVNAFTFVAMLVALRRMHPSELERPERSQRRPGALREALRYVARTPALAVPLGMMALVGTLAFNFQVLLPLLARFSFHGGAGAYATLVIAMGAGSVIGALVAGARGRVSPLLLIVSSAAFGICTLLAALAPTIELAAVALALTGAASVTFAAGVNSALQLAVEPDHARAGHGPLLRRVPRVHAHRRPAGRLARGCRRAPCGPGPGRRGGAGGRPRRVGDAASRRGNRRNSRAWWVKSVTRAAG